jgi:hypothetical protein
VTHHTFLTSSYKLVETKDILSHVTKFKAIAEYVQDITQEKLPSLHTKRIWQLIK